MHRLVITPAAKRALKNLPQQVRDDLLRATTILEENPYAGDKLSGALHFLYALHFKSGNVAYRVAYTIDQERKLIVIHLAHARENFYVKLRRLIR